MTFYITFQATGDPSSSPNIITFQATISIGEDKLPLVQECRIKSMHGIDESALANEEPELFSGLTFYFSGFYDWRYKKFLQDLVEDGGGAVLKSKDELEVVRDANLLVVYNLDPPQQGCKLDDVSILWQRLNEAENLTVNICWSHVDCGVMLHVSCSLLVSYNSFTLPFKQNQTEILLAALL